MSQRTGVFAIYAILAVFAALHLAFSAPPAGTAAHIATLIAGMAYLLMAISIFLATRPRFLEDAFGGLDRIYKVHKMSGVTAGLLVLVHFFTVPKSIPEGFDTAANPLAPSGPLGMLSLIALIIVLAITLNRKIAYHRWRLPHKLMGVVFILITAHFFTVPPVFFDKFGPSGFVMAAAALIGLVSYGYNLFGFNKRAGSRFVIETVNHLERATEIVLKPLDKMFDFKPGQFAFLELQEKGFTEPHPFTIASAPGDEHLRFTVKVLGDWTRKIREELKPGVQTIVHGPYGRFDSAVAGNKQIWLAGGIGVTPFLSTLRHMKSGDPREIGLIYAVREQKEALFLDEIKAKARELGNFKVVMLESNKKQFAQVAVMKQKIPGPLTDYEFFLCGPKRMTDALIRDLRKEGVARARIHVEAFEFR